MKILHVIRRPSEPLGFEVGRHQGEAHQVAFLLIQDGVWSRPDPSATVYALRDDLGARGLEAVVGTPTDYDGAVRLMAEADKVIVW
jgi:sulfur transfer complex TusBCD TusB component (DsrH family)